MIDAILHAARVSDSDVENTGKFMWHQVVVYISRLFEKRSPTSLDRVIALISPYVPWNGALNNLAAVSRWAAAALAIPYTEEVGQNVIDALFQIAFMDFLRPHIPTEIWMWLKRRPPVPPLYCGLQHASYVNTVAYVRRFGDVDLLKSYFLFAWTNKRNAPASVKRTFAYLSLVYLFTLILYCEHWEKCDSTRSERRENKGKISPK